MSRQELHREASARARTAGPRLECLEARVLLSATTAIVGDYNGTGSVEQGDLDLVLNNWGRNFVSSGDAVPSAWTNDLPVNTVDQGDLDGVLNNWGASILPGATEGRVIALQSGATITNHLGTNTDVDTYTIQLDAGDTLLLTVQENLNFFTFMQATLFGPDNRVVENNTFTTGGDLDQFTVNQSGTYTLVIRDRDAGNSGQYSLTAVVIDDTIDADNVALTSGQTFNGSIGIGDIDTFTIQAQAGNSLLATFQESLNIFTFIEGSIFGPDGQLIQTVTDTTGGDLDQVNLTQSGTYTIVIRDRDETFTGDYGLTAVVVNGQPIPADNVALTSGQTVNGSIGVGDIDTFTIAAQAGDSLLVAFSEIVNSFTFIEGSIFGPNGQLIQTVTETVGGDLDQFALTQTGLYTIAIRDRDETFTGDYALTAVVIDNVIDIDNTAISSGFSGTRTLTKADIDTFTFNGTAGQNWQIRVAEVINAFTFLEVRLFAPDRTLIDTATFSSSGDVDQASLPQTGRYTIVVRDRDETFTGDYTISATLVAPITSSFVSASVRERPTRTVDPLSATDGELRNRGTNYAPVSRRFG